MAFYTSDQLREYRESLFRYDFKSGISVFLVALPLCLGIALASGAPLFSGLLAGIVAGLFVSVLSGSEVSVSGPAAGLTVIVAQAIANLGSFPVFLVAVVLAGVLQILLGVLKAGRLGSYFPESVIRGMLVGIGIVIILKQIPHALGDDRDYEGEFEFLQADNENTFTELIRAVLNLSPGALVISAVSLLVLLYWDKAVKQGIQFFKTVPSGVVVVLIGVALNELFRVARPGWYLGDSSIHMVAVPPLKGFGDFFNVLTFPDFSALTNPQVYIVAGTLAVVASLESLLSLEAAEAIDPQRRIASPNRELYAQGVGNVLSGLVGGLPVTAVVVRTSANVYSGARTRMSAFVHGVLLLVAVLFLSPYLNRIPLACLAAILLMVGYKLANPALFRKAFRDGWSQFIPFMVTILLVVFQDLLIGIAVGTAVGLLFVVYTNFNLVITVVRDGKTVLLKFNKDATFLNKAKLKTELAHLQPGDEVYIDASRAHFIDYDIRTMLREFRDVAPTRNITVDFRGINFADEAPVAAH